MMRTVQLAIADSVYANALRDALAHSGPWRVETVERPDPALSSVLVLDELNFQRLNIPLPHPQRAWEAGIVSVASLEDSLPTVLLAVMAASLRVEKHDGGTGGISPSGEAIPARITPGDSLSRAKRCRTP